MNVKLVSTLVLALPAMSLAQDAFDKHCANIQLLQDRRVQTELKITAAQRQRMNVYADAYTKTAKTLASQTEGGRPSEATQKKILDAGLKLKNGVVSVISATQLRRLREISLQVLDARAVADDKVAARIGLSATQLSKYRSILTNSVQQAAKVQRAELEPIVNKYKGKKPKNQAEGKKLQAQFEAEFAAASKRVQPKLNALSASASKQLKAVLTAKQLAAFEALKGKRFAP